MRLNPDRYGHKAARLAALAGAGFDVPDGFVVPVGHDPSREELAAELDVFGDAPLAVRSSSVAEDLADASFAGQYVTVLDVRGADAVLAAVARVRESATSHRARSYGGDRAVGMAVLIQRLVKGDASGVAFSANPVTGSRGEVLITAVRGLGEALVSGEVPGDEWRRRRCAAGGGEPGCDRDRRRTSGCRPGAARGGAPGHPGGHRVDGAGGAGGAAPGAADPVLPTPPEIVTPSTATAAS